MGYMQYGILYLSHLTLNKSHSNIFKILNGSYAAASNLFHEHTHTHS